MGFDLKLADRIRQALAGQKNVREVTMFQGMCFMVDDKMCICLRDYRLMCRVGPEKFDEAVEKKRCRADDPRQAIDERVRFCESRRL